MDAGATILTCVTTRTRHIPGALLVGNMGIRGVHNPNLIYRGFKIMATVSMRDMPKAARSLWSPDPLLEPENEAFHLRARNKVHIINPEKNCTDVQRSSG